MADQSVTRVAFAPPLWVQDTPRWPRRYDEDVTRTKLVNAELCDRWSDAVDALEGLRVRAMCRKGIAARGWLDRPRLVRRDRDSPVGIYIDPDDPKAEEVKKLWRFLRDLLKAEGGRPV